MKKTGILCVLLFVATLLCAQTGTITFRINLNNIISSNGKETEARTNLLPLKLFFDTSFKGKTISFFSRIDTPSILIMKGVFGGELNKADGSQNYKIQFMADGSIQPDVNELGIKAADGKIFFKIDGIGTYGPIYIKPFKTAYVPGFIVRDALKLSELNEYTDNDSINRLKIFILRAHGITNSKLLEENKFLDPLYKKLFDENIGPAQSLGGSSSSSFLSGALSSIGGLDVTGIADGFAKFIVKRVKEELAITFFEKFRKDLSDFKDIRTVFPHTYQVLDAIGDQIYNFNNYVNNLREAFRTDLLVLDEHLPTIVDNHQSFFSQANHFELGVALRSGCYISNALRHNTHPGDLLDGYPVEMFEEGVPAPDTGKMKIIKGSLQALQLLSESLKESDTLKHRYWVEMDQIRELVKNQLSLQIYLGLVIQRAHTRYDNVSFGTTSLYKILNDQQVVNAFTTDYPAYKKYILTLGTKTSELNKMITEYQKPSGDSVKIEQYIKYFKTTIDFIQFAIEASKLPYIKELEAMKQLDKNTARYFGIINETSDLVTAINRKKYPEMINHLVVIYSKVIAKPATELYPGELPQEMKLNKTQSKDLAESLIVSYRKDHDVQASAVINNWAAGKDISIEKDPIVHSTGDVQAKLVEYGAFMASMINAQNSSDVEAAIEGAVLPVGSARIKKGMPFNVSANAYCGLFIGNEIIKGLEANKPFDKVNSYGLTAPIGISINWGKKNAFPFSARTKRTYNWSHSIFISLVDIGAVAAFRFTDDSTEKVPTIQLKDIFSPGLFWSIGVPNAPLSVNVGAQIGPNLRKVNSTANDYSGETYVRYSISVCVDLPLLNLYTKTK